MNYWKWGVGVGWVRSKNTTSFWNLLTLFLQLSESFLSMTGQFFLCPLYLLFVYLSRVIYLISRYHLVFFILLSLKSNVIFFFGLVYRKFVLIYFYLPTPPSPLPSTTFFRPDNIQPDIWYLANGKSWYLATTYFLAEQNIVLLFIEPIIFNLKLSVPPILIYIPSDAQLSPLSFGVFKSVFWYGKFNFILVLLLRSVYQIKRRAMLCAIDSLRRSSCAGQFSTRAILSHTMTELSLLCIFVIRNSRSLRIP